MHMWRRTRCFNEQQKNGIQVVSQVFCQRKVIRSNYAYRLVIIFLTHRFLASLNVEYEFANLIFIYYCMQIDRRRLKMTLNCSRRKQGAEIIELSSGTLIVTIQYG